MSDMTYRFCPGCGVEFGFDKGYKPPMRALNGSLLCEDCFPKYTCGVCYHEHALCICVPAPPCLSESTEAVPTFCPNPDCNVVSTIRAEGECWQCHTDLVVSRPAFRDGPKAFKSPTPDRVAELREIVDLADDVGLNSDYLACDCRSCGDIRRKVELGTCPERLREYINELLDMLKAAKDNHCNIGRCTEFVNDHAKEVADLKAALEAKDKKIRGLTERLLGGWRCFVEECPLSDKIRELEAKLKAKEPHLWINGAFIQRQLAEIKELIHPKQENEDVNTDSERTDSERLAENSTENETEGGGPSLSPWGGL